MSSVFPMRVTRLKTRVMRTAKITEAIIEGSVIQIGFNPRKIFLSVPPEMGQYLGGPDPEGAQRATKAMLEMKKIDLATMKKAYLGD